MTYTIAALYRFVPISNPASLCTDFRHAFENLSVCGTLLVAPEGINGTLAGSCEAIDGMLHILHKATGLPRDDVKFSASEEKPFKRLKVRLKREIITFKQPKADPSTLAGTYVEAKDWNKLLAEDNVVLLDTRNFYETMLGTFRGAEVPQIEQFTEFADYVRNNLQGSKNKKIAMFCTGGIRCEKASAFMRSEGFEDVYHLKGGILKYLEDVPKEESTWNGDCYVFDRRVAVGHGLVPGPYGRCACCGYALKEEDKAHGHFEDGVSCAYCFALSTDEDKARFRMRHGQMMRALEKNRVENRALDTER